MSGISGVDLGAAVVDRLAAVGISEVVLAPGSRNAPLAFAVWARELDLHTRIDERSAGFLALGLTKVGARAAVICTSGTAVANLHPAVLEAAHAAVPMVVVSADRPTRLMATGANQTTDQVGIFGPLVPTYDVADLADLDAVPWDTPGPLHVNVRLDEPLVPGALVSRLASLAPQPAAVAAELARRVGRSEERAEPVSRRLPLGPRTVVVAGDDAGPRARLLAEKAGWPLLAEPSSGARRGSQALRTYRLLLGTDLGAEIERVVVFGRPTLSRPVTRLLARSDVEVLVVPGRGVWPVRPPGSRELEGVPDADLDDPAWFARWKEADTELGRRIDRLLTGEPTLTPYDVAAVVAAAMPAESLLVVGASSPIRDLDVMAPSAPVAEHRLVIANRGLSGIDGTISTAIGAAIGRRRTSRAVALMGDVTFLHDQSSLVLGPDEARPDLTIVVVNDDGGAIFSMLEQGAPELAEPFERLFGTPHGADLASLCAATRTAHLRVTSRPELEQALASPNGGIEVIEVVVDRTGRRDLDARIRALASAPA
ncbi:2-succinyl-5-enolpyruvyl-6-hydroxy-3-cyclohexene-1-carboxylic-acid synthase [Nocardioides humilatus]|uniref:2-succinyl-5-enolpyruvyl-6-hydroxy-3-cyclohexene-1-carboxylate synthase n=1 Tax=Nocardioides humilatus TaxID=2607660 RepID=A0A5B1LH01_9ACTN|nr:2-succinyl-5-enolpyruvyl-6-hydroxy-3-cyclohexene-1-carboxylic-acid synthase [Nocardioides humilatus]KAA1419508.1 2-succinyl-5-enolpyruvyl-6-hydroxy-3-cyclohexene-1-carboxylic-acid synthase [Nocardioides humilatus]